MDPNKDDDLHRLYWRMAVRGHGHRPPALCATSLAFGALLGFALGAIVVMDSNREGQHESPSNCSNDSGAVPSRK